MTSSLLSVAVLHQSSVQWWNDDAAKVDTALKRRRRRRIIKMVVVAKVMMIMMMAVVVALPFNDQKIFTLYSCNLVHYCYNCKTSILSYAYGGMILSTLNCKN